MPLKRIYAQYLGKGSTTVARLDRPDERWYASLAERVTESWRRPSMCSRSPISCGGGSGGAWITAFGELGAISPRAAEAARTHKRRMHG
ncbi:hypothetical protein GCM10010471_01030 [Leucobacter komagatae]